MNSLDMEVEGKEVFLGICLDDRFGQVQWTVMTDQDASTLKEDMVAEGYNLTHSFIVRIPLPDVTALKRDATAIQVREMKDLETPLAS